MNRWVGAFPWLKWNELVTQEDGDMDSLREEVTRLKATHVTLRARVAQLEDSLAQVSDHGPHHLLLHPARPGSARQSVTALYTSKVMEWQYSFASV